MSDLAIPIPDALVEGLAKAVAGRALELIRADLDQVTPWMTADEAMEYLRMPKSTFKELSAAGLIPRHQDEGVGRFYYDRRELDRWRHREEAAPDAPALRNVRQMRRDLDAA